MFLAEDIHKNCGTYENSTVGGGDFGTIGSFTGDRWTQLTLCQEQTCGSIFRSIG